MISLRSFQTLFQRYSAIHRSIPLIPRKIRDDQGTLLARIERERIYGNMHWVRGWTLAQKITIATDERVILTISPSIPRSDVQAHYGGPLQTGFELQMPLSPDTYTISFINEGQRVSRLLRKPPRLFFALEAVRLAARLVWTGLRGLPDIFTYLYSDAAQKRDIAKQRLKILLGLGRIPPRDHLFGSHDLGLDIKGDDAPALSGMPHSMTIVLPVYNAFNLLRECLDRVCKHTDLDWHLVMIEDCSTDDRIRSLLRDWALEHGTDRVTLLENETNLGFIGSVNRGFSVALGRDAPIVLLNSDALVPDRWATRLLAPLANPSVASVTPMSNNAEILTAPVICQASTLLDGAADRIDASAAELLHGAPFVNLPTGVGFCMAIARDWLARLPVLDTTFGRGYGEEVDWCRKVLTQGGEHVAVPNLFVEHRGGESFGSEEKRRLVEENGRIISQRHTGFDAEVQDFIVNDPLIGPRLILGLAAISGEQANVPIYLCHSLGGGAEDATLRQISMDLAQGLSSVLVRVGGRFRYDFELHTAGGMTRGAFDEDSVLEHAWRALPNRRIIYVCGVGDLDAPSLPDRLQRWTAQQGTQLIIEIHDFFPISPAYTLLDSAGHFTGAPRPDTHGSDPAHSFRDRSGRGVDLREWQDRWHRAMTHATEIVVFSANSNDLVTRVWPDLAAKIRVRPHPPLHVVSKTIYAPNIPARTIGVLGNIGYQKGAAVLQQLSKGLRKDRKEGLVVIGNIDPTYPLSAPAIVHGSYARENVATLAESYGIDCWLIPSIWPETFSFATHEALATGLPVWCFDLGAPADALRDAGYGDNILPLPKSPNGAKLPDVEDILNRILDRE
jgi:GT2 family glycosyltransferase/glycosyltransferase involved in cell wall biosynthesis